MLAGVLPIQQQILVDLIAPPLGAVLWRFMARGRKSSLGEDASEETRRSRSNEFWIVLVVGYLLMFGISLYTWLA